MFGPDLFSSLDPPFISLTLQRCERPEADDRKLTLTIRPPSGRGMSLTESVSRYSPEATVLRAVSGAVEVMALCQGQLTRRVAERVLKEQMILWVDPF